MRVRWTTDAADDLERICDYIAEDRPDSAPTATMFLRTEPWLLDQFIAALPALDASDGGQAVLQCVPLPDDGVSVT